MAIILRKGLDFTAEYTSTDYPTLSDDWTGLINLYSSYPGTVLYTKALTRAGNVMVLDIPLDDILNLSNGQYYFETIISNTVLGVSVTSLNYATVAPVIAVDGDMTTITMTIVKVDGTPAGEQTRILTNTADGTRVTLGWKGVQVRLSHPEAYNIGADIIGVESIASETNAAGYTELQVLKGSTVVVACPSLGKSVTVDTTGLDTVDLSTYF